MGIKVFWLHLVTSIKKSSLLVAMEFNFTKALFFIKKIVNKCANVVKSKTFKDHE